MIPWNSLMDANSESLDSRSKKLGVKLFECHEIKKSVFPKLQNIFYKKILCNMFEKYANHS